MTGSRATEYLPAVSAGILFSGSFVAAKVSTLELLPLTTTFFRYLVAFSFLNLLIPYFGLAALRLPVSALVATSLLALSGIVGYHYLFFLSLNFTEVANTAIINAMSPVVTAGCAALVLREKLTARNYLGVLLAFSGVLLLLTRGDASTLLRLKFGRGDLLMLGAVLCWVGYSLYFRHLLKRCHSFALTYYSALVAVLLLAFPAARENAGAQLRQASLNAFFALLYMGVFASGLGYLCYNFSIKTIGPTLTASVVYSVVPLLVVLLGYGFFDEPVTPAMALSAILVVGGIYVTLDSRLSHSC